MKISIPTAILLCCVSAPVALLAQADRPVLYVSLGEYFGTVYTEKTPLPVEYVHFRGEPLKVRVTVANRGEDTEFAIRPGFSHAFTGALVPQNASSPRPKVDFAWERPVRRSAGLGRRDMPIDLPAVLGRSESIGWLGAVTGLESVPAGVYKIVAIPRIDVKRERPIAINNDEVTIELRDVKSVSDRLEVLRIRATRAFAQKDLSTSDRLLHEMVALYGNSGFAYQLLGDVSAARNAVDEARAHYRKALDLVRSGADGLFSAVNTRHTIDQTIEGLQATITRLDRR